MLQTRPIGTPVRCPKCHHPNLAIDIWCERCGTPLDWQKSDADSSISTPSSPLVQAPEAPEAPSLQNASTDTAASRVYCWSCGSANPNEDRFCQTCGAALTSRARSGPGRRRRDDRRGLAWPRLRLPTGWLPRMEFSGWQAPRLQLPRLSPQTWQSPRLTWVAGAIVAALLIVPLVYTIFPAHGASSVHSQAARPANGLKPGSPQAVAAAAVEQKTGLKYSSSCQAAGACLTMTGQTFGQSAAAILFSSTRSGAQQCVGYVAQSSNAWQLVSADCAAPGQVAPLLGQTATVHVSGSCVNVRDRPSLQGGVLSCFSNGSAVHVDGGPTFADGLLWWHVTKGWISHTFLVAP